MSKLSKESIDQRYARTARVYRDNLTAHMHEFLHAYKSGERIDSETETFFVEAFEKFLCYQRGYPDSPAQDTRKALSEALEVSLRKRGKPAIEGAEISTQFKLAWQVQVLYTREENQKRILLTVEEAITLVAKGMSQTFDVVKTARSQQMKAVLQEVSGELAVFEDWVVPKRRSAKIAQQLVDLATTSIEPFELALPLELPENSSVLNYPPSRKALGQMMIGHEMHGDYLARVLAACSETPQKVYTIFVNQLDALELLALGEGVLKEVVANSETDV